MSGVALAISLRGSDAPHRVDRKSEVHQGLRECRSGVDPRTRWIQSLRRRSSYRRPRGAGPSVRANYRRQYARRM
jgi:hypothetical protein